MTEPKTPSAKLAYIAAWQAANRDKVRAAQKRWRESHPEEAKARKAVWRKANRDKINAQKRIRRNKTAGYVDTWAKNNPGLARAKTARRKARLLKATPAWADHKAIAAIYAEAAVKGLVVDHIVPLQSPVVCGLHVHNNLQLLSRSENARKGNRL